MSVINEEAVTRNIVDAMDRGYICVMVIGRDITVLLILRYGVVDDLCNPQPTSMILAHTFLALGKSICQNIFYIALRTFDTISSFICHEKRSHGNGNGTVLMQLVSLQW